jgi:hypothetical protein
MNLGTSIKKLRRRLRQATPAQVRQGTAEELEHAATIKKIKADPAIPVREAAKLIAKDHLKEDPAYYEKLKTLEVPAKTPGLRSPLVKLIATRGRLKVYRVDDTAVRKIYPDWTMGGHGVGYSFIPKFEVWIAGELGPPRPPLEEKLTMLHELRERRRMIRLLAEGKTLSEAYEIAHNESLEVEDFYRKRNGRGLTAALKKEQGQ